jgi:hypothetical protein
MYNSRGPGQRSRYSNYATCWTIRGTNPGGGEILRNRPDGPWGPTSSNTMGTGFSPGVKRQVRDDHPPHLCRGKRKSRAIPLLPVWAFMAWSRANFIFTFYDKPQRYVQFGNTVNNPLLVEPLKYWERRLVHENPWITEAPSVTFESVTNYQHLHYRTLRSFFIISIMCVSNCHWPQLLLPNCSTLSSVFLFKISFRTSKLLINMLIGFDFILSFFLTLTSSTYSSQCRVLLLHLTTIKHTTHGKTPLDEGSAHRRSLYLHHA